MERIKANKNEKTKKIVCIVLVALAVLALGGLAGFAIGQQNKQRAVDEAREAAANQHTEKETEHNQQGERPAHEMTPPKTSTELTCNADELSLSVQPSADGAAAGSRQYDVVLENVSGRICTLGGYPGVSLVNENGNMIGQSADRVENAEEQVVTLNPGTQVQSAITMPNSDNFPAGECQDGATKLRVYPPNDTGYLSVATDITSWCPGFNVAPVVAM